MDGDIYVTPYFPNGVQHIITTGGNHYIGCVDQSTVLKYPHFRGSLDSLKVESGIFQRLGRHPRIIEFKGWHEDGILLEYAPNKSLETFLRERSVTTRARLQFAKETAEGVAYVHQRNVLVCDIHVRNILLDSKLHVKLCDFQGRLLGDDGQVLLSGGASENAESFMPRSNVNDADIITDIFALGSTIYYIMTGHRAFPHYDTIDDESLIANAFREGNFPVLGKALGGEIVRRCWSGEYRSAEEVSDDLCNLIEQVQ